MRSIELWLGVQHGADRGRGPLLRARRNRRSDGRCVLWLRCFAHYTGGQ